MQIKKQSNRFPGMLKYLSFPLFFLLLAGNIKAQDASFKFGIKAGANMNKLEGVSFKDEFTYGYQAGAFAELNFSKRLGIQPEVLWNESSVRTSSRFSEIYKDLSISDVTKMKLNYLTIPILLNIRTLGGFFTFQVGPQYGILMNKDKNLLDNGKEVFKNGNFSMVGGAQIKILKFRAYGRYVAGMQNINDIDNRDKWNNQALQFGIGLAL